MVCLSQQSELIHIPLWAGQREFDGILDSGASSSLMTHELAASLGATIRSSSPLRLRFADNKTHVTTQVADISITFKRKTRSFSFRLTPNLPFPCLCGIDFMKVFHVVIICSPKKITVKTEGSGWTLLAELPQEPTDPINISTVTCRNDTHLPAMSRVQVAVLSNHITDGVVLIEPHMMNCCRNNITIDAGVTFFRKGMAYILVTNLNSFPVQIHRHTSLGFVDHGTPSEPSLMADSDKVPADDIDINPNLSPVQKADLKRIVTKHSDLFAWRITQLPRTPLMQHRIELLPNSTPPFQRPYRTSRAEEEVLDTIIEEMLDADILERSCSPYSSPYLLVRKKNGTWRLVHNFIKLNEVTKKDRYPLPRIDDLLDHLLKKRYFSTFDLFSGFYQLELHPDDREKTSFLTRQGSFQFKRMPMGICNAPSSFQRLMNMALGRLIGPSCLCYMDDVCVFGTTFQEHLQNLEQVFRAVRAANLRFQLSKCSLGYTTVKFLGMLITPDGLRPDPDKVRTLKEMPNPSTVKQVRSFLGLASFYRRFIRDFAAIAVPLYELTHIDHPFLWTHATQQAKDTLVRALTSTPILVIFNPEKPVFLHCDASRLGLGCIMSHSPNSDSEVVGYFSRSLNKAEKNYTATEIEMLAVIFSIRKTRHYVYQQHFTVVVDHHSLCFLLGKKDTNGRLLRWQLYLQEYDFEILYKKGRTHCNADCLSRFPLPETLSEDKDTDHDNTLELVACGSNNTKAAQESDEYCRKVFAIFRSGTAPDRVRANFVIRNGILYKVKKTEFGRVLVVALPEKWLQDVLEDIHDGPFGCHRGTAASLYRFNSRFYIPNADTRVRQFIRSCDACQKRKPANHKPESLLQSLPNTDVPFAIVCIDFAGPLVTTPRGNKHIIVLIDVATRYIEAKAVESTTAEITADFLVNDLFFRHGAPDVLISDRGTNFLSRTVRSILRKVGTDQRSTSAYNPRCNGLVERQMKTIAEAMSMYVQSQPTSWDLLVPCVRYALNTSQHEVMKKSPYELLHFRPPTTFIDNSIPGFQRDMFTRQLALIRRIRAQAKQKIEAAQSRRVTSQPDIAGFQEGDLVLVHKNVSVSGMNKKFQVKKFGPYIVTKRITPATYEVKRIGETDKKETVNLRNLKRYVDRVVPVSTQNDDKAKQNSSEDTSSSDSDDDIPGLIFPPPNANAVDENASHAHDDPRNRQPLVASNVKTRSHSTSPQPSRKEECFSGETNRRDKQKETGAKKEDKPGHSKTSRRRSDPSDRPRSTDPSPSNVTVEHPDSDTMLQQENQFTRGGHEQSESSSGTSFSGIMKTMTNFFSRKSPQTHRDTPNLPSHGLQHSASPSLRTSQSPEARPSPQFDPPSTSTPRNPIIRGAEGGAPSKPTDSSSLVLLPHYLSTPFQTYRDSPSTQSSPSSSQSPVSDHVKSPAADPASTTIPLRQPPQSSSFRFSPRNPRLRQNPAPTVHYHAADFRKKDQKN